MTSVSSKEREKKCSFGLNDTKRDLETSSTCLEAQKDSAGKSGLIKMTNNNSHCLEGMFVMMILALAWSPVAE